MINNEMNIYFSFLLTPLSRATFMYRRTVHFIKLLSAFTSYLQVHNFLMTITNY